MITRASWRHGFWRPLKLALLQSRPCKLMISAGFRFSFWSLQLVAEMIRMQQSGCLTLVLSYVVILRPPPSPPHHHRHHHHHHHFDPHPHPNPRPHHRPYQLLNMLWVCLSVAHAAVPCDETGCFSVGAGEAEETRARCWELRALDRTNGCRHDSILLGCSSLTVWIAHTGANLSFE